VGEKVIDPKATLLNEADLSQFYWAIGIMIVMNLGTIITILVSAARGIWWVAKLDARVIENEKDINAAHQLIRELKKKKDPSDA